MSEPVASKQFLFIVGAPRSGTTWLQLLLSQHPLVATSFETHLFSLSLGPLVDTYHYQKERRFGLHRALSDDEMMVLVRQFADGVMERIAASRPAARLVLEKSPAHVQRADLIRQCYPEARFIHLVRDPRAVVASMRDAADRGATWASRGPIGASRGWAEAVRAGLELTASTPTAREVRYEALNLDTVTELRRLFEWLELPTTLEEVQRYVGACALENLQRGGAEGLHQPWDLKRHREGFFRRGLVDGWRDELTPTQVRALEYEVGALMDRLGYERVSPESKRAPAAHTARRVAHAIRWRVQRALKNFENRF